MRTPVVRFHLDSLGPLRTRTHPGVRDLVIGALEAVAERQPGVAASVLDVVQELTRVGTVRSRGTVADWLQGEAADPRSPVVRVVAGHYALSGSPAAAAPELALGPTHRRALEAARALHTQGRDSWTLRELVEEVAARGPAVGRRRLHDVVVELRTPEPALVVRVGHGRFRLGA